MDRSFIYDALRWICGIAETVSGMRRTRERASYVGVELFVLAAVTLEIIALVIASNLMTWGATPWVIVAQCLLSALATVRVLPMLIAHVSILLLNTGKTTPGHRVHSRLRYVFLTLINFVEVGLVSSLWLVTLTTMGAASFKGELGSDMASPVTMFHYSLLTAAGVGVEGAVGATAWARLHSLLTTACGLWLIVVVLAIVFSIEPDEEMTGARLEGVDYWNWRASRFASAPWVGSRALERATLQAIMARAPKSVADIGCGTGEMARALVQEGLRVVAIDSAPQMIEQAKRFDIAGIDYQQRDASDLGLPSESVDVVLFRMALHNFLPHWRPALGEAFRVLRSGGAVVIVEGVAPSPDAEPFFREVVTRPHKRQLISNDALCEQLRQLGFQNAGLSASVVVGGASVAAWLRSVTTEEDLRSELLKRHKEMTPAEVAAYNSKVLPTGDVLIDMRFDILTAEKP